MIMVSLGQIPAKTSRDHERAEDRELTWISARAALRTLASASGGRDEISRDLRQG